MRLVELPGVGDALADRLARAFGSEAQALEAMRKGEVARLAAVEGVSSRKAVEIVRVVTGRDPSRFLRTPRAEALYEDVLERIGQYANAAETRDRIQLLSPLATRKEREAHAAWAWSAGNDLEKLPRDRLATLLRRVARAREPRPRFDSGLAILVDTEADSEALRKAGVDKFCHILTPEDGAFNDGYDMILYAYTTGALDLTGAENVVQVPFTRNVVDLVPDAALAWVRENRATLEALAETRQILGLASRVPEALLALDRIALREVDFDAVEALVREVARTMNDEITDKTRNLSLSGSEVLEMMSGRTPRKVHDLQADVLQRGLDRLARETGDHFAVFSDGFPVKVEEDALDKKRAEFVGRRRRQAFRDKVDAARRLAETRAAIEREIEEALDFDYRFAIGAFVLDYKLTLPTWGAAYEIEGALHLDLVKRGGAPVAYSLSGRENVALLTGANSGGKTTLLETLAQAALLAHLGLPVNATRATVDDVEALYFFTQKRALDAGAFESFLKGFIPIVTSSAKKLVLADELEAMTELDAASKIVGTFVDLLHESGSYGVCVTHMAAEVSRHASVRIDGIEARGLDADGNLVVDRTPRMNYRARSTPEFILQRLAQKANGSERKIYEIILAKFAKEG